MHLLDVLPAALNKAAYPQIAGLPPEEAASFTCSMVRQCVLSVVPPSLVLGALAQFLLPAVYGQEYVVSVVPFLLLLPCVWFAAVDGVLGRFFNATNEQMPIVVTRSTSALVNLALNFWWIPSHGIAGAAAASCASFALQSLLAIAVFRARSGVTLHELLVLRRADVTPYVNQVTRLVRRVNGSAR
jgi:O-antigen/teichoic acid export membrane protein